MSKNTVKLIVGICKSILTIASLGLLVLVLFVYLVLPIVYSVGHSKTAALLVPLFMLRLLIQCYRKKRGKC